MALPAAPRTNRQWFIDRRAPDRRLQVTWHREQHTAVVSIWHADTCAASFQMPSDDAARLIGHLADGLAEMAARPREPLSVHRPRLSVSQWFARLRRATFARVAKP